MLGATLKERKANEADRRRRAVEDLRPALAEYARAHGGRFLLFGSAARGAMRYDSDVDIRVDFCADELHDAWAFAEYACWNRDLEPDIMPYTWCKSDFLAHVGADLVALA
jgi:predicted nucleotidyltransferase